MPLINNRPIVELISQKYRMGGDSKCCISVTDYQQKSAHITDHMTHDQIETRTISRNMCRTDLMSLYCTHDTLAIGRTLLVTLVPS